MVSGESVPAISEVGASNASRKGKRKASEEPDERDENEGEVIGSPDWPSNPSDNSDNDSPPPSATKERAPVPSSGGGEVSRIGVEETGNGSEEAWRDPLEEEEE